jgi:hypothetical protein
MWVCGCVPTATTCTTKDAVNSHRKMRTTLPYIINDNNLIFTKLPFKTYTHVKALGKTILNSLLYIFRIACNNGIECVCYKSFVNIPFRAVADHLKAEMQCH